MPFIPLTPGGPERRKELADFTDRQLTQIVHTCADLATRTPQPTSDHFAGYYLDALCEIERRDSQAKEGRAA